MENYYSKINTISSSQVDSYHKIRFDSILNVFQDLATAHSTKMGVDFPTLLEKSNAFWVLSKIKFKIEGNIYQNDTVEAVTWPNKPSLIRFLRNFSVESKSSKIQGVSEWCVLDATTNSIRKFDSICYPQDLVHSEEKPEISAFTKLNEEVLEDCLYYEYKVLFTDIDCNKHTNNVSYAKMALNCFTPDEFEKFNFNAFEIHFISQSYFGNVIKVYKKQIDSKVYIEGKLNDKIVFKCIFYNE